MALQKTITLPSTATGNYIRLGSHLWDNVAKRASAHFDLYASAEAAAASPGYPLRQDIAVLRLVGPKFDAYLSTAALAALSSPGPDPVRGQLYAAAKAEPLIPGGDLTSLSLADAIDV